MNTTFPGHVLKCLSFLHEIPQPSIDSISNDPMVGSADHPGGVGIEVAIQIFANIFALVSEIIGNIKSPVKQAIIALHPYSSRSFDLPTFPQSIRSYRQTSPLNNQR